MQMSENMVSLIPVCFLPVICPPRAFSIILKNLVDNPWSYLVSVETAGNEVEEGEKNSIKHFIVITLTNTDPNKNLHSFEIFAGNCFILKVMTLR